MNITLLPQYLIETLGWTLIHWLWQGLAVALILAVVLKAFAKVSANKRYLVGCACLAAMMVMPMLTFKVLSGRWDGAIEVAAVEVERADAGQLSTIEMPVVENAAPAVEEAVAPVIEISFAERISSLIEANAGVIVYSWLIGVFGFCLWHLGGWRQLQKLRRTMVKPVGKELLEKMNKLADAIGVKRVVSLTESALVAGPIVVGWLKPMILLPGSALTGLSLQQIEAILAHELAHIKRCDYLVNIIQTAVEIVGFYNPAIWWVSAKIRQERENCCDDVAVALTGDKVNYVRALTTMEEVRSGYKLAVAGSGGSLFDRAKRLLTKDRGDISGEKSLLTAAVAVLLLAMVAIPACFAMSKNTTESIKSSVTISGQVIEEDAGKPIIGALVRIAIPATDMRKVRVLTDHVLYETNTNDKGNFNIELPLNDARYISVDVLAQGFRTAAGTYRSGGDFLLYKIAVEPDEAINLSIKLPKALYIAGTVKDDNGKVISGVKIHGQMTDKKGYGVIATTESDKYGKFELFDFPVKKNFDEAGVLLLKHQQFENVTISNLYEMSPDELSSIEIVMPKGWKITGTVLNSSGQVVPSAKVEATLGPGMIMKECLTNPNGRFELAGLKKGPIILIAYLSGTNQKTEETLVFNGKDRDVTLKIQPVELTEGIKKIKLFGMEVADATPSLQKLYNLSHGDEGVVILNLGTDYERLGIGKPEIGNSFWIVGHKKIKDVKEMISEMLRINGKAPTTAGRIDEGHHGFVRIVYDMRNGTNTQYLKLTDEDVRQLRDTGRQLGIPEDKLYEGVTTGDSLEEKERKNRFESGDKLMGLGKKMLEYANDHEGKYPSFLEDIEPYISDLNDFNWIVKNVEYFGKDKSVVDRPDTVLAYDKALLMLEDNQGTNILYNDSHVSFENTETFKKFGTTAGEKVVHRILTVARIFSIPADLPLLKDIISDDKSKTRIITPEELEEFLKVINTTHGARRISMPKILTNDSEAGEIRTANTEGFGYVELKFKNTVGADRKTITLDLDFEYGMKAADGYKTNNVESKATLLSGNAIAIDAGVDDKGNKIVLIVQPEILERQFSKTGVVATNDAGMESRFALMKNRAPEISITVFPIIMSEKPYKNVAEVVALMLEKADVNNIDVPDEAFSPAADSNIWQICSSFEAFVREKAIDTDYALFGQYVGTPQSGVKEVRCIIVEKSGNRVWVDRQTPDDDDFKRIKPNNPMLCSHC